MNVSGAIVNIVNIVLTFVVSPLKEKKERLDLIINIFYMTRAKFPV